MKNSFVTFLIGSLLASSPIFALESQRPPQYVVISFDGSKSINMWKETRRVAKDVRSNFTYFLSGVYFLTGANKNLYRPPQHSVGRSDIGFGRDTADLAERVQQVEMALNEGAEMASHVNGHFDGSKWSYADWSSEFEQFHQFILKVFINNPHLNVPSVSKNWEPQFNGHLKGFRAPLLAINGNSDKVLNDFGYSYDASRVAAPTKWPYKVGNVWQFPLATIPIAGTAKKTISMDYNFYYQDSKAKDDLANAEFYENRYFQSLLNHFTKNYYGNRAPINVGNHFANWNGGAYFKGLMRFATEVCGNRARYPEVSCINYKALVEKLNEVGEQQVIAWEKGRFPRADDGHELNTDVPSLFGQNTELDFDLDLRLINGTLKIVKTGTHRNIVALSPDVSWTVSLWPTRFGPAETKKLGLQIDEGLSSKFELVGASGQIKNQFEQDGNFVLQISVALGGKEIQTLGKKVAIKNGKVVKMASVSEEQIAAKGDLSEAHLEE